MTDEGTKLTANRDSDYFHRRAAEARAAACSKDQPHQAEIAGELALAYAALARRRAKASAATEDLPAIPLEQPA
jgi:pyridoxine/pyridoxamine 5'-phosphate oxidase